ncbi:hypothetical protein GA0115239_109624 [Streptomyces sp. BpilaLS-43]|uniref:hypothetical protein n=1 Tax=Streptomyces sp. BpilaLS-43 TaxID=1839778 RepID=UPI00081B4C68|nr:hypothetical protein [Streptomyces sp. BpilaLS-43]SCD84192.1 hypothetical protein GA0115239_109624 [Streptomyces sp. BpilaLS-43]
MARFHHTVTVTALDRAWFEDCAALLLDVVESTRTGAGGALLEDGEPVPGVRLVKGRHLRAGARYTFTSAPAPSRPREAPEGPPEAMTVRIQEWRRSTAIVVEQRLASADLAGRATWRLRTPERPSALAADLTLRRPGGGFLQRVSGRARADLGAWWAAAAAPVGALPPARAPLTARARHPLGRAAVSLAARPAGDGAWRVGVTLTVSGRALVRPPAALVLLLFRIPLGRAFRSGVDGAAARWNETLGGGLPSPEALRAEFTEAMAARNPPDGAPG